MADSDVMELEPETDMETEDRPEDTDGDMHAGEQPLPLELEAEPSPFSSDDMRVLEALLFAAVEPMTTNQVRARMGEEKDIGGMLMELKRTYEGRGVQLVEMDGSWAFRTATDLADSLEMTKEVQRKMSRAAMETLAIVAYHQPVTRAEIENIRGVATNKGTLDVLLEAGWVKPGRRRETPGRPLTWVTTTSFLDHFGMESINELPGLDELKASGLLDRRPAIATVGTGSLFGDDLEDLEREVAEAERDGEDDDFDLDAEFGAVDDADDDGDFAEEEDE